MKLFCIRDSKAEIYNTPFVQKSHGEAERTFSRLANEPDQLICRNPEDFDLFFLGEFDELTGKISPMESPLHLKKAIDFKRQ